MSDEQLPKQASTIIEQELNNLTKEKEKVVFAVCGGRNVAAIFDIIKNKNIEWNKIHFFIIDERQVPIDDNESNYLLLKEHLTDHINIPKENIHPYHYDKDIKEYEEELTKIQNYYDIVLLSAGEDGHIAGLYPNHHSIKDETEYFITMNDSPKPPKERMSSSKKLIEKSSTAIIMFNGNAKKDAYDLFRDEKLSFTQCPAKIINKCKKTYILTHFE